MVDYSKKYECGCGVVVEVDDSNYLRGEIVYCPKHAAAPEMFASIVLGEGFHTDGPTLLEEAAFELGRFSSLSDELTRMAQLQRAALELATGDDND